MKRLLNALSLVWNALKVISMLNTFWNFLRDHYEDLF